MQSIERGLILEGVTPYTYGDWLADQILALAQCPELTDPVILPQFLGEKSYVRRDLDKLGREYIIATTPVAIAKATLLRKARPVYYWLNEDVAAYRRAMEIEPPDPLPGSLIYLSRENAISEVNNRTYPSKLVSELVHAAGGQVIDTATASPSLFDQLAHQAESVICDQGSAISGVLHWKTKRVLELTNDDWWHNFSLFVSRAAKVRDFEIIVLDRHDTGSLTERINAFIVAR